MTQPRKSIGAPDCSHVATAIEARLVTATVDGEPEPKKRGFIVMEHGDRGRTAAHVTAKEADFLARKLRKLANDLSAAEARGQ